MSCRNCGNELPDGATFCPRCGARMVAASMLQVNAEGLLEPVEVSERNRVKSTDLSSEVGGVKEVGGEKNVHVVKSNATQPRLSAVKPVNRSASARTPEQAPETDAAARNAPEADSVAGAGAKRRDDRGGVEKPGMWSQKAQQQSEAGDENNVQKKHEGGLSKLWKVLKGEKE